MTYSITLPGDRSTFTSCARNDTCLTTSTYGTAATTTTSNIISSGEPQMQYAYSNYAWPGLNLVFCAIAFAILVGVAIVLGYSIQDWLKAAAERKANFIKSIQEWKSAPPSKRR
jgi:hypothetical protein